MEYDGEVDNFSARKTKIALYRYREFVAKHPNQTTYFRPILDVLDYAPSRLENVPFVAMVEGKNDFYSLSLAKRCLGSKSPDLNLLPGGGAGSLDTVIKLYFAWGRSFVILLDSDKEGEKQKKRYLDIFGPLLIDRVFCLGDIDPSWSKHSLEEVYGADLIKIQQSSYPNETEPDKTHFNRAVQEMLVGQKTPTLAVETQNNFGHILAFLAKKLHLQKSDAVPSVLDI